MIKIVFPEDVRFILETIEEAGYQAYCVGGCIRDAILGHEPKDWDISTSATPDIVDSLFDYTIPTGIEYGTVSVMMNRVPYEITTFRKETDYDGRRPNVVEFSTDLMDDALRRDFTMNCIYVGLDGVLLDPFNGIRDIENYRIACVGNAHDRIEEDKLRALRAIRFASRYAFDIDEDIVEEIQNVDLSKLSRERVRDEFSKILLANRPSLYLDLMCALGLMQKIFPTVGDLMLFKNISGNKAFDFIEPNLILRLSMFFGSCLTNIDDVKPLMKELKFSNLEIKEVLLRMKGFEMPYRDKRKMKKFLSEIKGVGILDMFQLLKASFVVRGVESTKPIERMDALVLAQEYCLDVLDSKCPLVIGDLAIDGRDLIELGYKGEEIGKTLEYLLDYVLDYPRYNKREKLLNMLGDVEFEEN